MRAWAEFLPAVMLHLPGCPEFVAEDAIRTAAIEFCVRTRVWKLRQVTLATSIAGQAEYFITNNPTDAGLCHLHAAWVGQNEVLVGAPGDDLEFFPGETDTGANLGSFRTGYSMELTGRASVALNPAPTLAGQIIVATVSYAPTPAAYALNDAIYFRWHEAIEKKAMHDLMIQVGKPWSDPQMAVFNRERFERLKDEAANTAGPVRKQSLRVTPW